MSTFHPGQIEIAIGRRSDGGLSLAVASRRPQAASVLVGKTPEQALKVLPLLFSVCAQGQHVVAQAALAAAGAGVAPPSADQGVRVQRVALVEHLWRLLLDWPAETDDGAGRMAENKARFAGWFRRLRSDQSFVEIQNDLERQIPELRDWAKDGTEIKGADEGCGAAGLPRFPSADDLLNHLKNVGGLSEDFCVRPNWQGFAVETGSFEAHRSDDSVAELSAAGRTLAARRMARVMALSRLVDELGTGAPAKVTLETRSGQGAMAAIETARGCLVHDVALSDGVISHYAILAPTEWNFHPESAWIRRLEGALNSVPKLPVDDIQRIVHAWAMTIDPCVPIRLIPDFDKEN